MTQSFRNIVNGELVDAASGATYDVIDPTTGEAYASAPTSGPEDVDRAYAAADAAFEGWGRSGSFLQGQVLELANAVVLGAPVLVFGFLTTLLLCLLRGAARRA